MKNMTERGIRDYYSKEIKKAEIKYHIKSLINKLKKLNKRNIAKDHYQPDEKPFYQDYGDSKTDFIEFFHENDTNKNNFFKRDISNSIKNNIYIKYSTKKEKDFDKKANIYATLIKEIISGEKKEEDFESKELKFLGNRVDFYKYYKIHREKMDRFKKLGLIEKMNKSQPVLYNPNYDYIHKKIKSGPEWNKITGRNHMNKTKSMTLSSQSNRKKVINFKENEKDILCDKFEKTQKNISKFNNRYVIKNMSKKNHFSKISKSIDIDKKPDIKNIIKIKNNIPFISRTQRNYKKLSKPKYFSYTNKSQEKNNNNEAKKIIQLIINGANSTTINYDFIRERVKMMVNYKSRKINNRRIKELKGCENGEFLDTLKCFKSLKGEKNNGLNFGKMASRPSNNILPSFMCGNHSRIAYDTKMDESLKMNNYSAGRFSKMDDFVIPRSFNKYINLSLLKSQNIQPESIFNLSEFKYLANRILPEIQD